MVAVEQCARCLGCFTGAAEFGELLTRDEAGSEVGLRRFVPLPPGKELPRQILLALVRCPRCGREMERARFAREATIIIDVCPAHGVWLDAGELVLVMNYVRNRTEGEVPPSPTEIAEAEAIRRLEGDRAMEERIPHPLAPRHSLEGWLEKIGDDRSYHPTGRDAGAFLAPLLAGLLRAFRRLTGG
jgi:Zn-finger nucleic acid-binding protein